MNKQNEVISFEDEDARKDRLDESIHILFGTLEPKEVDRLRLGYSMVEAYMFEVMYVGSQSCKVVELFEDIEFEPVVFPPEIMPYLRTYDVFLGTLGFKNGVWTVLCLGPVYEEMNLDDPH